MKNFIRLPLILACLFLALLNGNAQGWERKYAPDIVLGITSFYQMPNHGYITAGWNLGAANNVQRVMKTDSLGNITWYHDYPFHGGAAFSNTAQDGGMLIIGDGAIDSIGPTKTLMRIDAAGNLLWQKTIYHYETNGPNSGSVGNIDIDTTNDGGFICAINGFDSLLNNSRISLLRLNGNGDTLWQKSYYDTSSFIVSKKYVYSVRNAKDGGFLAGITLGDEQILFKVDANGTFLWQYAPSPNLTDQPYPTIAKDGNILIAGNNYIGKLTQSGQPLWRTGFPALGDTVGWSGNLIERPNNTYALLMEESNPNGHDKYRFVIADSTGKVLMQNKISTAHLGVTDNLITVGNKIMQPTADGGYVAGFWIETSPYTDVDHYSAAIVKMDSNGAVYLNQVSGNVYNDFNLNCQQDSGDLGLKNIIISFTGKDTFQVATDINGNYWGQIDTGTYKVQPVPQSPYWAPETCNPIQLVVPAQHTDTIINMGMKELVSCPYITVDGAIFHIRTCIPGYYMSNYCNTGTAALNSGLIEVDMDSLVVLDSTTIPMLYSDGTKYYFKADTLQPGDCSSFIIYFHTPCDESLDKRTECIRTAIAPNDICLQPANWDKSNLKMAVLCDNQQDSVVFTLQNIGTGTMAKPENLIVIEDNVILRNLPVQLNPGEQLILKEFASGATYRASVPQTPNNPISSFATAAIEGCVANPQQPISKGFIIDFPINGVTAFEHTTCNEINYSYDPNHKSVVPVGVGDSHLTDTTTEFEYTIEFQNTGTDTAYQLHIIDTLAPYLDPATIKLGLSSNKYTFTISGNGILTFTFVNINLPDSGHNQMLSSGFLQFTIRQRSNNVDGTVINNDAAIYFDYNSPVITNTVFNTIGRLTITAVENLLPNKQVLINAYPNPFADKATIKVTGENFKQLQLIVYDLAGKKVREQHAINSNQFEVDGAGLSIGNYLFEIKSDNLLIGRGKLVVQ